MTLAGAATRVIVVTTNTYLSRENTSFVGTNICHDKHSFVFAATKLLSRQKGYLWQLPPMIGD